MLHSLAAYFTLARLAFRRQNAYRLANWAGLFTNIFFLFFRASLFEAIYPPEAVINRLTMQHVLSYVCLTQSILMVAPQWGFLGVEEDIRSGQIATHLSRPVNYYLSILAQRLGTSGFYLFFRTAPLLLVGVWAKFLFAPASWWHALGFLVSVYFGAWIAISLHFIAEISAFWMESSRGVKMLFIGLINFFSGMIIPVTLFPEPARQLSRWLPFEYTLNAPALIYLGATDNVTRMLMGQLLWMAILWAVCRALLARGEHKLMIHGG